MKEAREPWLRRGFDSLSICFCALADGVVAVCMQCFICLINKISWRACESSDLQIYPERLWLAIWGDLGIFVLKFSQVTIKIRHVLENSDSLPVTCLLLPLQTIWYPAPLKEVTDSEGWVHTGNMNTRAQWLLPRSSEELNGRICFGFV